MSRPDNVKCENCAYWWQYQGLPCYARDSVPRGECRRGPPNCDPIQNSDTEVSGQWIDTEPTHWCGEFRAEWPLPKPTTQG